MKKADLIKILVPATIKYWEDIVPEYTHKGKERQLARNYWGWNKEMLLARYNNFLEKGYIQ